jgi:hypothetical protein
LARSVEAAITGAPHDPMRSPRLYRLADIVQTVTIDQTVESAAALGIIVLVRTFLSFSLEIEMDGVVPWRRAQVEPSAEA